MRCSPTADLRCLRLVHKTAFLLQVILVFVIIQFKPARYEGVVFPSWAQGIGWAVAVFSLAWIPVCAIHTLWVLPGSFLQVTSCTKQNFPWKNNAASWNDSIFFSYPRDRTFCRIFDRIFNFPFHSLQKLKLSVTPYALDKMKKSSSNEMIKGLGKSELNTITFHDLPKKAVAESKFWDTHLIEVKTNSS